MCDGAGPARAHPASRSQHEQRIKGEPHVSPKPTRALHMIEHAIRHSIGEWWSETQQMQQPLA